jgi:hypothetical protein
MDPIGFWPRKHGIPDLRAHVQAMPSEESICGTCGERIRTTPAVHADGSVHWASGGWEHIETEKSGCEWASHPYGFAAPPVAVLQED